MLPSCLQDLVKLRHLDIRGCYRLKETPKGMSKLKHLSFLSYYFVGEHEENGIRELGTLDNLHGSFCIYNLENVKNSDEALEAKMGSKKRIDTLKLQWLPDGDIDSAQSERDILDKLQPHQKLKELSISGYRGETFPNWLGLSGYAKMTQLNLDGCKNCREFPSLGQLPSLQHLEISNLDGLEKIDFEIYNKSNGSFEQETAFKSLETLKIKNMRSWREWHFPDEFDGFPRLRIFEIINCPALSGDLPAHLPALEKLNIAGCEELACLLPKAPNLHGVVVADRYSDQLCIESNKVRIDTKLAMSVLEWLPHIQPPRVQSMQISGCGSAISISDYLPASLDYLRIYGCSKLTFSEQLQHKSLTMINVDCCDFLTFSLGDFPNLVHLGFAYCERMEYFVVPQALPSLRSLRITNCDSLVSLPVIGLAAPHLQELEISNCSEIDCFAEDCLPPSLKILDVFQCHKLTNWIASKSLQSPGLTHLKLYGCNDVKSFPREGCLPASLESLQLLNFPNLETLDCKGFHHLTSLKYLEIESCLNLKNITQEHLLPSIEKISIWENCPLIGKLEEIQGLRIEVLYYKTDEDYYWANYS